MNPSNFTDFSVAYHIYTSIDYGVLVKANSFAKTLNIAYHIVSRVTKRMAAAGVITSKRGYSTGGITKLPGFTVKDVFKIYGIEFVDNAEISDKVAEGLAKIRYAPEPCEICEVNMTKGGLNTMCTECEQTTAEPLTKRLAKCGHPSFDRYFHCRVCMPELPSEDVEFELC